MAKELRVAGEVEEDAIEADPSLGHLNHVILLLHGYMLRCRFSDVKCYFGQEPPVTYPSPPAIQQEEGGQSANRRGAGGSELPRSLTA